MAINNNSDEYNQQVEIAHILVNDFMERFKKSKIVIDPQIISAVLFKTATEILIKEYGNSPECVELIFGNIKQISDLYFRK